MAQLREPETLAALTAITHAGRLRKHVAIRPLRQERDATHSPGVEVPKVAPITEALSAALRRASQEWPTTTDWQVFGSDNMASAFAEDFDAFDRRGDGCFFGPSVFGEFSSLPDTINPGIEREDDIGADPN